MEHAMNVLYRNRSEVLEAGKNGGRAAWEALMVSCPEITQTMSFNTFRINLVGFTVLMALVHADQALEQDAKVTEKDEAGEMPKSFQGWTVQRSKKDGFVRLYKSFSGKVKCLYIGKSWDEIKASTKISKVKV